MRTFIVCAIAVMSAGGCRHANQLPSACAPGSVSPGVIEERCPSASASTAPVSGPVVSEAECASAPSVCLPPAAANSSRSFFDKCCLKKETRTPEIHVNVPAPKIIVQRSEKSSERAPAAARAPKPGNDVMLVPTVVYVPYGRITPTGNATMVPVGAPSPPAAAAAPCNPPAAAASPVCATPPCNSPTGATCIPGAANYLPVIPPANLGATNGPSVDDLNRRCTNLENKIDTLIEALNKSRANGQK